MWLTILKFLGVHKIAIGAGVAAVLFAGLTWGGFALYNAGYDAAKTKCELAAANDTIELVTEVANTNASVAVEAKAAGDAKAKVLAARVNKNWARSEELNNTIYKELADAQRSNCHVSDVGVLERAAEWVRRDVQGGGANGAAEGAGLEGGDGSPAVSPAAAP